MFKHQPMTAEEIINKHIGIWSVKYPNYIHESYIRAMQEIAELAFEAGGNYEFGKLAYGVEDAVPTKKQFIRQLFPTEKTSTND